MYASFHGIFMQDYVMAKLGIVYEKYIRFIQSLSYGLYPFCSSCCVSLNQIEIAAYGMES